MKDYRLSEIQAKCKERKKSRMSCDDCEFYTLCSWQGFGAINIEPRDMIELPYKERRVAEYGNIYWDVYFRNKKRGYIDNLSFWNKAEADAFLERLKGDKK